MCQNFSGITRDTAVAQAGVRPPGNLVSSCMHCYTHSSCLGLFCKYRLLYSDSHLQIKSGSRSFPPACYLIPDFLHACLFFFHSLITLARFPGLPWCRTRCRIRKTYVDVCMHHRCTRMCMCVLTDCKALARVTMAQRGWTPQGCTDYRPANAATAVGI